MLNNLFSFVFNCVWRMLTYPRLQHSPGRASWGNFIPHLPVTVSGISLPTLVSGIYSSVILEELEENCTLPAQGGCLNSSLPM